jgi:hypothetical protein
MDEVEYSRGGAKTKNGETAPEFNLTYCPEPQIKELQNEN